MGNFLKKNLVAGLLAILPIGLTIILLAFFINLLDRLVAPGVRAFIIWSGAPLPEDFHLPGLGFMLACLFVFGVGVLTANIFGKKLVALGEYLLHNIPFVRSVYSTIKSVIQSISEMEMETFEKMALVHYPHGETWVMGLVACNSRGEVVHRAGDNLVNVFIPMLPNVTLGWLIVVPREQVTVLQMSREEGIKMLLSFGIVEGGGKQEETAGA